jgi:hypothetical protein
MATRWLHTTFPGLPDNPGIPVRPEFIVPERPRADTSSICGSHRRISMGKVGELAQASVEIVRIH